MTRGINIDFDTCQLLKWSVVKFSQTPQSGKTVSSAKNSAQLANPSLSHKSSHPTRTSVPTTKDLITDSKPLASLIVVCLVFDTNSSWINPVLEKMHSCHYQLHHLPIPKKLHRTPGAGPASRGNTSSLPDDARRVVGTTVLPPKFFEDNKNMVVVGSFDHRADRGVVTE